MNVVILKLSCMLLLRYEGFPVPKDLATISFTPKTSQIALIGPPAIIPVPLGADLSITFPAPSLL